MKPQNLVWIGAIALLLALSSCNSSYEIISKTQCKTAIAIATQTWEVEYYINKTSGGFNTRRTQSFQSNTLTNINGAKPVDAVTGPDDEGVWWAALPPRPTVDEVDQNRQPGELRDPPLLQRSVNYQLRCEEKTLLTDALTYREVSRAIRSGQAASVTYIGDRALKVES